MKLIDKDVLVTEIEKSIKELNLDIIEDWRCRLLRDRDIEVMKDILSLIDTLEVIDPYKQCIQYASIEDGIKAHSEIYSFNIESELFNQLTKEQQALWRKEIEQACISGGHAGVELVRDPRYKENLEIKEVDLEKEMESWRHNHFNGKRDKEASGEYLERASQLDLAKHFFELGLKTIKGE